MQHKTVLIVCICCAAGSTAPQRQLLLHDMSSQHITGHHLPITYLATHPHQPLALTLDAQGLAMVWHTQPLTPLGTLQGVFGGPSAGADHFEIKAACWLDSDSCLGSQDLKATLAVGSARQFQMVQVSAAGPSSGINSSNLGQHLSAQVLAYADMLEAFPLLQSIHLLHSSSEGAHRRESSSVTRALSTSPSDIFQQFLLVGLISQGQQQPSAKQQQHTPSGTHADAIAVWKILSSPAPASADSEQSSIQQSAQQPQQQQKRLQLLFCHRLLAEDKTAATCGVVCSAAWFDYMVAFASGVVQLLAFEGAESPNELPVVKELRCPSDAGQKSPHVQPTCRIRTLDSGTSLLSSS